MKYKVIKINQRKYPNKLKKIKDAPKELYAIGNIDLLKNDMIAVIGTRRITDYGKRMAEKFCKEIALRGITIISGMAIGTDSIAHKCALKYGAPTIAVLGTGLNNIYPAENKDLYQDILNANGLIISEVGLDIGYNSKGFPRRNRIVSGLAECVLVIEAAYRSGTSITVKYAREQEKMVFAVPGILENSYGVGVNKFIKEGAKIVTEINDILEYYPQFMNKKRKTYYEKSVKSEYKQIYMLLQNQSYSLEELYKKVKNKSIRELSSLLTMMELDDLIVQNVGNGYKIKENDA